MKNTREEDGIGNVTDTQVLEVFDAEIDSIQYFNDPLDVDLTLVKSFGGLNKAVKRAISREVSSTDAEREYYKKNGYGVLKLAPPPYNLEELASYYDTSPINHAAVNAKVSNIVGLGYSFEITKKAADRLQNIEESDARSRANRKIDRLKADMHEWLESLNDEETFQHTLIKGATDYEVFGNCYFEVGRTVSGEIGYFGHIPASTVRVRSNHDGFIQIVGNIITYFRNFGQDNPSPLTNDTRPNEILHISKYSPKSSFYGVPDSVSCGTAIVGDMLASKYNLKFFDNSATPRYIVTLTGARLSKASEDKLFRFLQTSLRGEPHRTLFLPLPSDPSGKEIKLEMHRVDSPSNDSSWEDYRERNKQDILSTHLVPLNRIGGSNEGGVATSLASDRMFKEQVVVPTQAIFEHAINRMMKEQTDIVYFDLNELTLTDELAQSQIHERYLRNKAVRVNEVRAKLGLPADPEGDVFFEPTPKVTAEQNAQAGGTRERDKQRVANNSDSSTTVSGRNAKGEGSKE